MATRKRKKRKKYHTGTHHSPKCKTPVEYRSGWELVVCRFLDDNPTVMEYEYESVIIPYLSNPRTGKVRSYYPDFLVTYSDGTRKLVEVKRKDKLNDPKVVKKAKAAEIWAKANNVTYEMWTNTVIEAFRKINEANHPTPKKVVRKKRRPRAKSPAPKVVTPKKRVPRKK